MSLNAYQKAQSAAQSPREAEYRIFAQVTHAMVAARDKGASHPDMVKAVDWNKRLWSVLSSDCGVEGNGLPRELRAQIISLGLFVSRFSSDVIRGRETVDTLVDINRNIMEGLAMRQKAASQSHATAANGIPGSISENV